MKKIKSIVVFMLYGSLLYPQSNNWFVYTSDNTGLSSVFGYTICYDNNNIWCSTWDGFIKFDGAVWTEYSLLAENYVIIEDHSGNIWIGSNNLTKVVGDSIIQYPNSLVDHPKSLAVDPENNIWVASNGLFKFCNGNYVEYYDSLNSPLIYPWVFNILSDNNGKIWGLNKDPYTKEQLVFSFDGTNWETFTEYLPNFWHASMAFDSNNNLWFCNTDFYGFTNTLIEFDGSNWNQYPIPDSLGLYFPTAVTIDNLNRIWIVSDGSFILFNGTEFIKVSDEYPGFEQIYVTGIAIDDNNNKWLSTFEDRIFIYNENGITAINVDELPYYQPADFNISQNYPNPFNPTTTIKYTIPNVTLSPDKNGINSVEGSRVQLKVYDILGNEIATLVNEEQNSGTYEIEFNPASCIRDLASGIYFYRLQAGSFVETKKMMLLK